MDVTFPNSLSRMRKPIIPPLLLELRSSDPRQNPCPDHLSISSGIAQKQKGRVGKNNTGAIRKFYELIIQKAQRLKLTTYLACFVKYEKYYFAELILIVTGKLKLAVKDHQSSSSQ